MWKGFVLVVFLSAVLDNNNNGCNAAVIDRACEAVRLDNRVECGYLGINKQQCEVDRRCCWDGSAPKAGPWCFTQGFAAPPAVQCNTVPNSRRDCGWYGINQMQCTSKGCCWGETPNGKPWCYYDNGPIPASSKQFFLKGREPTGLTGDAAIEQTYNNNGPYFFTMYSRTKRSAVYSAYRVLPTDAAKLGSKHGRGDWEEYVGDPGHDQVYRANTGNGKFTRGHLNPSNMNSFDQNSQSSTFTFSNAVPQWEASNSGKWERFEATLMSYAKDKCGADGGTLYLLTGPGDFDYNGVSKIPVTQPVRIESADQTQRLPVPPVLWTAGCCWNKRSGAESLGVIGLNKQDKKSAKKFNVGLNTLQTLLGSTSLFPGDVNGDCGRKNAKSSFPLGQA